MDGRQAKRTVTLSNDRCRSQRGVRTLILMADLPDIDPAIPPSGAGCAECLATDGWWFHLRRCATCGHIGCCDSSPNKHASRRAREQDHPVARSAEPGEEWSWCYVDQVAFLVQPSADTFAGDAKP